MYSKMGMPYFMSDTSALLALKNAWSGALAAADRLRDLAPTVDKVVEEGSLKGIDFETYRAATLAQANAAQALRGLVEELERKSAGS